MEEIIEILKRMERNQRHMCELLEEIAKAKNPKRRKSEPVPTQGAWTAYSACFWTRYHVTPSRNARVNSQMSQIVKAIGPVDAPRLVLYYMSLDYDWLVRTKHPIGTLLMKLEQFTNEWRINVNQYGSDAAHGSREYMIEMIREWDHLQLGAEVEPEYGPDGKPIQWEDYTFKPPPDA